MPLAWGSVGRLAKTVANTATNARVLTTNDGVGPTRRPLGAVCDRRHDAPLYLDAARGTANEGCPGVTEHATGCDPGSWGDPPEAGGDGDRQ